MWDKISLTFFGSAKICIKKQTVMGETFHLLVNNGHVQQFYIFFHKLNWVEQISLKTKFQLQLGFWLNIELRVDGWYDVILGMLSEKGLSGTSPYLEDIPHHPEVHHNYHDGWYNLHWTGFCLRLPKIYMLNKKCLSGTSSYLEDILHHPDLPDDYHDGWDHLQWTGFCLRFPKIYNT